MGINCKKSIENRKKLWKIIKNVKKIGKKCRKSIKNRKKTWKISINELKKQKF